MWDWLSIIVIVAIILVVADGLRRKFRERNALRFKLDKGDASLDPDEDISAELPAGGARTIPRSKPFTGRRLREEADEARIEPGFSEEDDASVDPPGDPLSGSRAEAEDFPHMPETEPEEAADPESDAEREDPAHEAEPREAEPQPQETPAGGTRQAAARDKPGMAAETDESPRDRGRARASRSLSERFFRHHSVQNELPLDPDGQADEDEGEGALDDTGSVEEVIVINVMAPAGQSFEGGQLLQVLLRQGMRLGHMSIFHRHVDSNGSGPVMFSMANMVKPGTFDMATMEDFTTPGVSLFTQLPSRLPHMKNFDRMLETAQLLRDELGGDLKDENRSVLTRQTIAHYRQRIRDFELERLARK